MSYFAQTQDLKKLLSKCCKTNTMPFPRKLMSISVVQNTDFFISWCIAGYQDSGDNMMRRWLLYLQRRDTRNQTDTTSCLTLYSWVTASRCVAVGTTKCCCQHWSTDTQGLLPWCDNLSTYSRVASVDPDSHTHTSSSQARSLSWCCTGFIEEIQYTGLQSPTVTDFDPIKQTNLA